MALWLTDGVVHLEEILCSWIWNNPRFVTGSNWSKTVDEGKEHWESNWYTRDSGSAHANVAWINISTACSRKVFRQGNIFELLSKPHFWVKGRVLYSVSVTDNEMACEHLWVLRASGEQSQGSASKAIWREESGTKASRKWTCLNLARLLPKRETVRRLVTRGGCCSYYWFKMKLFTVGDY